MTEFVLTKLVNQITNSDGTLTISPTTGNVVASLALGHANTWTAAQTFNSSDLLLFNPAGTFAYTFAGAAITAARTITLPLLTAGDTMAVLGFAQTWNAVQTFGTNISILGEQFSGSAPTTNQVIQFNGTNWVAATIAGGSGVTSVSNGDGTLTISPTTGAVIASLNLSNANDWLAIQTFGNGSGASAARFIANSGAVTTSSGQVDLYYGNLGNFVIKTGTNTSVQIQNASGTSQFGVNTSTGVLTYPYGAAAGYFLQSDSSGNASWINLVYAAMAEYVVTYDGTTIVATPRQGLSLSTYTSTTDIGSVLGSVDTAIAGTSKGYGSAYITTPTGSTNYPATTSFTISNTNLFGTGSSSCEIDWSTVTITSGIVFNNSKLLTISGIHFVGNTNVGTVVHANVGSGGVEFSNCVVIPNGSGISIFDGTGCYGVNVVIGAGTLEVGGLATNGRWDISGDGITVTLDSGASGMNINLTGEGTLNDNSGNHTNLVMITGSGTAASISIGNRTAPVLSLAQTWSALQTFNAGDFAFGGYGHDSITSPAAGDIWYYNGTNLVNLPIGSTGQVLTVASGEPSWATGGGGAVSSVSNSDGTLTISPTTGAVVGSLALGHANTWTALQKFTKADLAILGSSTGYTLLESGLSSSSNNTLTLPTTSTDTLAALGTIETFSAAQTFSGGIVFTTTAPASGSASIGLASSNLALNAPTGQSIEFFTNGSESAIFTSGGGASSMTLYNSGTNVTKFQAATDGGIQFQNHSNTNTWSVSNTGGVTETGPHYFAVSSLSGTTTIGTTIGAIILNNATSAAYTLTLPAASSYKGAYYVIIKTDSSINAVTVSRAGSDTIQGSTTLSLSTQYSKCILVSDGTSVWYDLTQNGV